MDQVTDEHQGLANQLRLDLLLRRLGSIVLRRKFKEIYAKLTGGKEWKDGPETGEEFIRSKWGNPAFIYAHRNQKAMIQEGNIQNWDLHCLQFVITQMLTTALEDKREQDHNIINGNLSKGQNLHSTIWDRSWWGKMSKIRQLANIRHSIAHMPTETLSQGEFDEKWGEAVDALKALGAKQEEIAEIIEMSESAFNLPAQRGQGRKVANENFQEKEREAEELRAKIEELQLKIQAKGQQEVKSQVENKVHGQVSHQNTNPVAFNEENELKANSLIKKGDSAGISGDWDKALDFYTRALEIPEISNTLRQKCYINRSWVHLRVLQMPEFTFTFNMSEFGESHTEVKLKSKDHGTVPREAKFADEKFLEVDRPKFPENLTEQVKEFHLTTGMADAESALDLSPDKTSPKALYRLAQFHQLNGDWISALTYFDQALGHSDLDTQLEFDRNVCQLELLNQTEVEEFNWITGQKGQTIAGVAVRQNPKRWRKVMEKFVQKPSTTKGPRSKQQLYAQVIKAHFLAQGISCGNQGQNQSGEVNQRNFDEVVKLYEGAGKGGLPSGLFNLGLLLQEGNGVQSADFSGAVRLFKTAAHFPTNDKTEDWEKEGILEAQYRLGLCYEFGLGVGKNTKKALHWYEMASLGDHVKASRKLGDIYSQGLLGVAKDINMAIFCWENAACQGDTVARTSAALNLLLTRRTWLTIGYSLFSFSTAISLNSRDGTPTMMTSVLNRKRHFQATLATVLQELTQKSDFRVVSPENEREPKETSWNIPAFVDHTLHTIHLLELVQTSEFQQKLELIPNWRRRFVYTERLVAASNSCDTGLVALQELNKLYRLALLKGGVGETFYPPNIRKIPGINQAILDREGQLTIVILDSFSNSIRLVGASFFRDEPTQSLVQNVVKDFYFMNRLVPGVSKPSRREFDSILNATIIITYILNLKGEDGPQSLEMLDRSTARQEGNPYIEPFPHICAAAVQGSLGKFDWAAQDLETSLKPMADPRHPRLITKGDLLFVQGLLCKSAGLTRGVNAANRKKVKEAMGIFNKFLSICPKDDPRRAEAHYQLGLCTLYLEKMKVKGQVKSSANDIFDKVMSHFTQGKAAEQDFLWKDFHGPYESPVKLILQRELRDLEAKKIPAQNLTSDLEVKSEKSESSCFGRLVDPFFKFPTSSFSLKLRSEGRIGVITTFRRFFKSALELGYLIKLDHLAHVLSLPGSPFSGKDVFTPSIIVGCYEIVEPVLHVRLTSIPFPDRVVEAYSSTPDTILGFTVVRDESGAVSNFQFTMRHRDDGHKNEVGQIGEFRMGARIIVHQPNIRLDADGGTSLLVKDAEAQIFHLPSPSQSKVQHQDKGNSGESTSTKTCGFCGKISETLQNCSKCKAVHYCGKECQKADWNELKHKLICPLLKPSYTVSSPL